MQKGHRHGGRRQVDKLKPRPKLKTAGQQRRQTHSSCALLQKFVNELRGQELADLFTFTRRDEFVEQFYYRGKKR
jgi:hypothetical protein